MRQHTPGPWRMGKDFGAIVSDTSPNPERLSGRDGEELAAYGGYIIAESIAKANRPLIAMAPELLAACEDMHKILAVCFDIHSRKLVDIVLMGAVNLLEHVLDDLDELEREVPA